MNTTIKHVFVTILLGSFIQTGYSSELSIKKHYNLDKLSNNVYVIHGPNEAPSKQNKGFRNNPVLVNTSKGIVVIDPGSSVYTGEMVVKKAKEISNKAIVTVFNTHTHGDHWLGNHGIKNNFNNIVIYSHPNMKAGIDAGDGETWVKAINKQTDGMIQGTKVVGPTKIAKHGDSIKFGNITFKIYNNGKAHSDSDLMIEIVEEKVFVFGDNFRSKNLSNFMASFKGNLEALDMGLKTKAKIFVPGHGLSGGKKTVKDYQSFITKLKKEVHKHYEAGLSDFEMKPKIVETLNKHKSWTGFNANIGRLINLAYIEVENELF